METTPSQVSLPPQPAHGGKGANHWLQVTMVLTEAFALGASNQEGRPNLMVKVMFFPMVKLYSSRLTNGSYILFLFVCWCLPKCQWNSLFWQTSAGILIIFSSEFLFLKVIFNWRITVLQSCLGFSHTTMQISHKYTYVFSLLNLPPTPWARFLSL